MDFVLRSGSNVAVFEVKSGRRRGSLPGMEAFAPQRRLLVGGQGIPVEEFLLAPVSRWLE